MFKPGDIAFFKEARKGVKKSSPGAKTQGHFFGVVLGVVPPFQKEPPQEQFARLMGSAGYISFDDVAALLGDKNGAKCLAAFEMRYFGKTGLPQFLTLREKVTLWLKSWFKPKVYPEALPPGEPLHEPDHEPEQVEVKPSGLVDPRGRPLS